VKTPSSLLRRVDNIFVFYIAVTESSMGDTGVKTPSISFSNNHKMSDLVNVDVWNIITNCLIGSLRDVAALAICSKLLHRTIGVILERLGRVGKFLLRPSQIEARNDILKSESGRLLEAPPYYGKVIVALSVMWADPDHTYVVITYCGNVIKWMRRLNEMFGLKTVYSTRKPAESTVVVCHSSCNAHLKYFRMNSFGPSMRLLITDWSQYNQLKHRLNDDNCRYILHCDYGSPGRHFWTLNLVPSFCLSEHCNDDNSIKIANELVDPFVPAIKNSIYNTDVYDRMFAERGVDQILTVTQHTRCMLFTSNPKRFVLNYQSIVQGRTAPDGKGVWEIIASSDPPSVTKFGKATTPTLLVLESTVALKLRVDTPFTILIDTIGYGPNLIEQVMDLARRSCYPADIQYITREKSKSLQYEIAVCDVWRRSGLSPRSMDDRLLDRVFDMAELLGLNTDHLSSLDIIILTNTAPWAQKRLYSLSLKPVERQQSKLSIHQIRKLLKVSSN
jgi:hypothetical protein